MTNLKSPAKRPLSPHLQVYRLSITFLMSGFHRVTGAVLYFGMLIPVAWLLAAASGPEWFDFANRIAGSFPGRFVLFGFSWGLFHHMLGGVRHLIWDTGRGLDVVLVECFAWATIIGSVILTVAVWFCAWLLGGL
jgi:succinate dehydrogenase / fumarate reductase cytochrome b subunit